MSPGEIQPKPGSASARAPVFVTAAGLPDTWSLQDTSREVLGSPQRGGRGGPGSPPAVTLRESRSLTSVGNDGAIRLRRWWQRLEGAQPRRPRDAPPASTGRVLQWVKAPTPGLTPSNVPAATQAAGGACWPQAGPPVPSRAPQKQGRIRLCPRTSPSPSGHGGHRGTGIVASSAGREPQSPGHWVTVSRSHVPVSGSRATSSPPAVRAPSGHQDAV